MIGLVWDMVKLEGNKGCQHAYPTNNAKRYCPGLELNQRLCSTFTYLILRGTLGTAGAATSARAREAGLGTIEEQRLTTSSPGRTLINDAAQPASIIYLFINGIARL